MSLLNKSFRVEIDSTLAEGWKLERVTQPSRLFGANGLRTGPDGRIYVAQVAGSQVSAIDIDTGEIETISPMGGGIVGPDDLAFDEQGNLYATEITEGRVTVMQPNGEYRVVYGDMPCSNPITFHQGHLYAGECRPGGRIMELNMNGGTPRIILDDVPMPNAFEVGPDGKLYFPVMGTNEIWRVDPQGGTPEVVARDLGVPDSVKFDSEGYIVSTQVASGQVLRIDPRTGDKTVLANLNPGLDNCTFVGGRLFVSSITGQITEILSAGETRPLIPDGFQWPMGIAVADDGTLFIADGGFTFTLQPGGKPQLVGMLFSPGFPGFSRGAVASGSGEWIVTTANGDVARYWTSKQESQVLASGFDQAMDLAIAPGGAIIFAELGTGRVMSVDGGSVSELASGLERPVGVAVTPDGACYVSESAGNRIVKIGSGKAETALDGLGQPEGMVHFDGKLFIVDVGLKEVISFDPASGERTTIASNLPVGAPPGLVRKQLGGVGNMSGPMTSFSGIAAGKDGTLYVAGDAEGSVLALRPGNH